jgi:TRAP-type C4-dicarboxylate transport system, small permease component
MLEKIQNVAITIQKYIFVIAISFMLFALAANVFMRYVFNKPVMWSEEVTSLMQGSMAFLGIGYCFARRKHTELTIVYNLVSKRVQALFDVITNGVMLYCIYLLVGVAFNIVSRQMIPLGTVPWLKIGYFYMMIPIGLIVGGIYILALFIDAFRRLFGKTAAPAGEEALS